MRAGGLIGSLAESLTSFPVLGLDFSDLSIKFARFDKHGSHLGVHFLGSVPLAEGILANGNIEKPQELAGTLKKMRTQDGRAVHDKFVVASLPEEKGFIQILRIAKARADNLAVAVRREMEGAVPLPVEDIYYDFEVVTSSAQSDHVDVLVLAYPRILVDAYTQVLKNANFTPVALELESQAIVRALISPSNTQAMLIIDLGATRTSFVLMAGGSIVHTSTISISGEMFEKDIAKGLSVSEEEARKLKVDVGLDMKKSDGAVARILMESLQPFVEEITRHFQFYRDHAKDRGLTDETIERIVLTGGDANLTGLDSFLSRSLKVDVEKWNPFALVLPHMGRSLPPIPANVAHEYTTAIGLALREIDIN